MYFSFADVTRSRRPIPVTLIGIALRVPTMGERVFVFPKKIRGKKVSRIIFSIPANAYPVSQVTRCINNHSGLIARTTTS